jgi:FkbM family methyltransferase
MRSALSLGPRDTRGWTDHAPSLMRLARLWNRFAPRGKGALPRWIGRTFGRSWRTICTTDSGVKLAVEPTSLDVYLSILRHGSWEPWIARALLSVLRSGGILVDVGANVGCISLEIAAARDVRVYAFEPQGRLARAIAVSAWLSQLENVHLFSFAVGDREGTATLYLPAHSVHASLVASRRRQKSVHVSKVSIDAMVSRGAIPPPNVMKIDVEGAELQVLQGSQTTIRNHLPALLVEANANAAKFGCTKDDVLQWISDQGDYGFWQVAPSDVLAVPNRLASELDLTYPRVGIGCESIGPPSQSGRPTL